MAAPGRGRPATDGDAVDLDYDILDRLRQHHPAWRLLRSDHVPLIASFLHRAFIAPNQRLLMQSDLAEALEDELFTLRERAGDRATPVPFQPGNETIARAAGTDDEAAR